MTLFDADILRGDSGPARYAEPNFPYLNRTGRADAAEVRRVLEGWFEEYPDDSKMELRKRFRSAKEDSHYGAFFELYIFALLRALGLQVEVLSPTLGRAGERRPDFHATSEDGSMFFVEATVAFDKSQKERAAERRLSEALDKLNELRSEDFLLSLQIEGTPKSPVPGARFRKEVAEFLATINPDEAYALWQQDGFLRLPSFNFVHDDWRVTVSAWAKAPEHRGDDGGRPIGSHGPASAYRVDNRSALRGAVISKATRYGVLEEPYVIAVNAIHQHLRTHDIEEALFGAESIQIPIVNGRSGEPRSIRIPDGAWVGPTGPKNRRVSAVIVGSSILPWSVAAFDPLVFHHPWAARPLADPLSRLTNYRESKNRMVASVGSPIRNLLGLPEGWPGSTDGVTP